MTGTGNINDDAGHVPAQRPARTAQPAALLRQRRRGQVGPRAPIAAGGSTSSARACRVRSGTGFGPVRPAGSSPRPTSRLEWSGSRLGVDRVELTIPLAPAAAGPSISFGSGPSWSPVSRSSSARSSSSARHRSPARRAGCSAETEAKPGNGRPPGPEASGGRPRPAQGRSRARRVQRRRRGRLLAGSRSRRSTGRRSS